METVQNAFDWIGDAAPLLATVVVALAVLLTANWLLLRRVAREGHNARFVHQIVMLALTAVALVAAVLAAPVDGETQRQLLAVLGLALTAIIALSSTTFVANAMAGLMLRAMRNFRSGDFIKVGDVFGRVSDRGLFHTEVQTEDRDLTTIPNLYLVSNPARVVRASGTFVSAEVSIGYGEPHARIERLLVEAAERAELTDAFVRIDALLDHAVSYRVEGFLAEVKTLLSARSRLRAAVLDTLHEAGVEIASPSLRIRREIAADARFIPAPEHAPRQDEDANGEPQREVFDKAEAAAEIEQLRTERKRLKDALDGKADGESSDRPSSEEQRSKMRERIERLDERIKAAEASAKRQDAQA